MARIGRLAVTAALGFVYFVLLVSAIVPLAIPFFIAAVAAVVMEQVLSRRAPYVLPEALSTGLGVRFRLLSMDVLTALLAANLLPDAGRIVALAIVAVLLLAAGRDASGVFARRLQWRRAGGPVSWRGLDVPGLPAPRPTSVVPPIDLPFSVLGLLIPLGYAVGSVTDRFTAAIWAQWLSTAVVLGFLVLRFVQYRVLERPDEQVREAVRTAIERHAPEVVLHHAGRVGTVEQVLLWVPALRALDRPCLVVVREAVHLDALADCGVPVVWAPRSQDVELFMVPSVDLALYPSDSTNINNHLLRVPGIYDVLVGHGDADAPENRSPLARMYDEIWVAGPAGRERYAYPVSGVAASKVKEIGAVRPPQPAPGPPPSKPTVVYAPAWENVVDAVDLSSLLPTGMRILEALLARQDVRTVFVPASATGGRLPAAEVAAAALRARVAAAGGEHATWPASRLPEALARAAFAVVDVAPQLAEAVRHDVPFGVPAVRGMSDEAMRAEFPSVRAGAILRAYPADVFAALDDALGEDRNAGARLDLGRRIDSTGDFTARFREAVDEAIAVQRRRRAFARPGV